MSVSVITVSSHRPHQSYYCYDEFFSSCRKHGCEPVVLGQNGEYKGLLSKPKLLLSHLLTLKAGPMIFSDCWDVVLLQSPDAIYSASRELYGDAVVFNAEQNLFPRADLAGQFPETEGPYRYLNSGFFCGESDAIIAMLQHMNLDAIRDDYQKPDGSWHNENDQGNFQQAFTEQPVPMRLDSVAQLCQTLHGENPEDFEFAPSGVRNKTTSRHPMAFHANGGGKTGGIMQRVLPYAL